MLRFESKVLKDNPLGDPSVREIPIYLPPSYFSHPGKRFPTIYLLPGFPCKAKLLLSDNPWGEPLVEKLDRLMLGGRMSECVVVIPDGFTRLGGSQYLNSIATGRYEDFIVRELVRYLGTHYRTLPRPGARAIVGKSSGGYGAFVLGARHPDVFGIVACHSGDMAFELCYGEDLLAYLRNIPRYGGTARFLRNLKAHNLGRPEFRPILNVIAMAAAYSPRRGFPPFELPYDERTGAFRPDVWREWLAKDPVRMVRRMARNLRKLRLLYFDCGRRDEYLLHYGARRLAEELRRNRVKFIHEEFDDGHTNIDYRYDRSFPLITRHFEKG